MNIIAFAASTHSQSINKQLVSYVAQLAEQQYQASSEVLDLNDYELPLYSQDLENEIGQPAIATQFLEKLANADALIISFAEHNGLYSAAYKNLFDWCSRQTRDIYANKAMLLLATSPGSNGGKRVLQLAKDHSPLFAGDVKASVSVPSFHENFDTQKQQIKDAEIQKELLKGLAFLLA